MSRFLLSTLDAIDILCSVYIQKFASVKEFLGSLSDVLRVFIFQLEPKFE